VAPGVGFLANFANVIVVDSGAELGLIDTGSFLTADRVFAEVSRWRPAPVVAAIYTHGHVDHAMGMGRFDADAVASGATAAAGLCPRGGWRRASSATSSPPAGTRRSTRGSSACRGCAGRPSIACPT
jgi:glyoxylase-like metal-dependent hydrolase (beta-lactamase superfamily II)